MRLIRRRLFPILFVLCLFPAPARIAGAQPPIVYAVAFPAPEHHYAQIEATFAGLPAAVLELRMSRSSPGRYARHEFAKNVFDVHAYDGAGRVLTFSRPTPHGWDVAGHDGTVRLVYKVFGDRVDGTYTAIDATHAHINMPAALMWARGLDMRPVRITFRPPDGLHWKPATQLFPTSDPWTFTAPNLHYLMDSPVELSDHSVRSFTVRNPDGREQRVNVAIHHDAAEADVDTYAAGAEKIVREQIEIFGELPDFETGGYTFLGDYLPWGGGDGMEHRNSAVVAEAASIAGNVEGVLGTVAHEFFHAWNVERIRPRSLEPFDFEDANMSGELWLAEGFTQYYGRLTMARAGLAPPERVMLGLANSALAVAAHPGHRFRSAVEMSGMAPFTDAARFVDPTNFSYAYIDYYEFGNALALALDLSLRARSQGAVSLDDYMRALWRAHGRPGGAQPGFVAKPYTLADARRLLADVSDAPFADEFFEHFVEGRGVPDYAGLLGAAGIVVRERHPGRGWIGAAFDANGRVVAQHGLVPWGSPAFDAGLEHGDVILSVGDAPYRAGMLNDRRPGETVRLRLRRRNGRIANAVLRFGKDPTLEAVSVEAANGTLTAAQKAFRQAWLGSKRR